MVVLKSNTDDAKIKFTFETFLGFYKKSKGTNGSLL